MGQVIYTPWCDESGKVIDDVPFRGLKRYLSLDAARSQSSLFTQNAAGLAVQIEDIQKRWRASAVQGPTPPLLQTSRQMPGLEDSNTSALHPQPSLVLRWKFRELVTLVILDMKSGSLPSRHCKSGMH